MALVGALVLVAVGALVLLPRWVARGGRPPAEATLPRPAEPAAPPGTTAAPPNIPEKVAEHPPIPVDRPAAPPARPIPRPVAPAPAPAAPPEAWSRALSEGLAALDRGQFAEAKAVLARAEAERPGEPAVADALQRAEEGLKVEALAGHRARGLAAEKAEDWKGAVAEYDGALKLEPRVAFALEGRARSLPRAEMDERLTAYLQRPDRLQAEAVRREAERVLDRARDAGPAGPRLQQQTAALERLLEEARTPLDVRLVSDGRTEVVVQRVGTLGTFREKNVPLPPGSYVVVGKRQGYRDTRKTLVVSPGKVPPPLDVRCDQSL